MRKYKLLLAAAVVAGSLLLASCATFKDPWVGKTQLELATDQGAPDSKVSDGKGGDVWVYVRQVRKWVRQMTDHGVADVLIDYMQVDQYYLDANGNIYKHEQHQQ